MKLRIFLLTIFLFCLITTPAMAQAPGVDPAPMDDFIATFAQAAVGGVPLFLVVFVLIEGMKRLKKADGTQVITGNGLLIGSFLWGLVIGVGYIIFRTRPPDTGDWYGRYVYWFAAGIYGIALGGGATIFYETLKGIVNTVITRYMAARGVK